MTVINMTAIVNEDVFFLDDDKEENLVELWAKINVFMKQQVKDIRTEVKVASQCLLEFRSKSAQIPVSVVSRFFPKHVIAHAVAFRLRLLRKISRKTSNTHTFC